MIFLWYAAVAIGVVSFIIDDTDGVIGAIFVLALYISVKDD